MVKRKTIRFDEGYKFYVPLKLHSFNNKRDYIIGAISDTDQVDAIYTGKISEFNGLMSCDLWLDTKGAHVVYIIGKRRSGKSYTLGTIAEGIASKDLRLGETPLACLILDTLNIFWTMDRSPSKENDQGTELKRWGLEPAEVSPLACYFPRGFRQDYMSESYREFAIKPSDLDGNDWANLFGLDPIVDPMGQLLSEIYEKVALEGYASRSVRMDAKVDYEIADMIVCLDRDTDIQRFPTNVREAIRRRLKSVQRLPVFSLEGTDIQELFKAGQVTVLLLRDLEEHIRGLVIGLLVRKIMEARGQTDECEKRLEIAMQEHPRSPEKEANLIKTIENGLPRGWILIDEAHNYIPQLGIIASKQQLKKYVNEGRNIGLSIAVTTQQPSGLDSAIRRNADILFIHCITMNADLEATRAMLNTDVPDTIDVKHQRVSRQVFQRMVRELELGFTLVSASNANRVFLAKIRPRTSIHGGREY